MSPWRQRWPVVPRGKQQHWRAGSRPPRCLLLGVVLGVVLGGGCWTTTTTKTTTTAAAAAQAQLAAGGQCRGRQQREHRGRQVQRWKISAMLFALVERRTTSMARRAPARAWARAAQEEGHRELLL